MVYLENLVVSNNNNVSTEQQETKEESYEGGGEKIRNQKFNRLSKLFFKFKALFNGYSTKARRVIYIVELLVVFCLCVLIFPFLLRWIAECFSGNSYVASDFTADTSGLDFLPDFLGGLIGILVGFFLDDFFIDQIKYLSKYVSLRNQIITEFYGILELPLESNPDQKSKEQFFVIIENIKENIKNSKLDDTKNFVTISNQLKFNELDYYYKNHPIISLFALSDIVDSVENSVVFNSLPLLFIPINRKRPVGEYLLRVKANVIRFNNEQQKCTRETLLFRIYVYIVKTLYFIDKRNFNYKLKNRNFEI